MKANVNQLVRSAVVLVVGLPVSLAILAQAPAETKKSELKTLKAELSVPCLKYATTKIDSKGERAAKDAIEEIVPDADFGELCKWVLK